MRTAWAIRSCTTSKSILGQRWLPAAWAMSIGALTAEGKVLPTEVSLTSTPGFEDAHVLAVGADALATWKLLTEAAPDDAARRS
jgi:hypothetical protein